MFTQIDALIGRRRGDREAMRKVEICVRQADLPREMGAMRDWLDQSGYVLNRFDCKKDTEVVLICVEFSVDAEADAFAARFNSKSDLTANSLR
jgi:hypothetical protein